MKTYTIGVDLGGTNIKAGLVDEAHHIVDSVSCKTNLPRPEHEVEAEIAALCSQLAQRAGLDMAAQIESVGIGTPGSVNPHTGVVEFNANFGYRNWPLVSAMEKLLPCRVYIENDANAAAYGEYIAGAAQGAKYAIAVTLGTGHRRRHHHRRKDIFRLQLRGRGDRAYGYRQGRAPLYVRAARLLGKICFRPCAG